MFGYACRRVIGYLIRGFRQLQHPATQPEVPSASAPCSAITWHFDRTEISSSASRLVDPASSRWASSASFSLADLLNKAASARVEPPLHVRALPLDVCLVSEDEFVAHSRLRETVAKSDPSLLSKT